MSDCELCGTWVDDRIDIIMTTFDCMLRHGEFRNVGRCLKRVRLEQGTSVLLGYLTICCPARHEPPEIWALMEPGYRRIYDHIVERHKEDKDLDGLVGGLEP